MTLIVFLSFFYSSARENNVPGLLLPDSDLLVIGDVIDGPELAGESLRFTIDQVFVEGQRVEGKVRLKINQEYFNNKVSEIGLFIGSTISAVAKLREPALFRNPGVYSYDLKKDGIAAYGYVKQMKFIHKSRGFSSHISQVRKRIVDIIDNSLSEKSDSFLKAIVLGLKGSISQEMRDSFSATGLAHLLSISGTHFGLLAFIIFRIVRGSVKLLPDSAMKRVTLYITPTQIAILCTMPVLAMYALVSGMNTPTVRSLIMVYIYMLALFIGRKGQWLNSLSIAAIIILLYDPHTLFKLSFQLSFIAVFSIGYVLEHRSKDTESDSDFYNFKSDNPGKIKWSGKLGTAVLLTISAVMGTAPLVAMVFKQFPLISPVTNLVVTPLVCFVILPLGVVMSFISGLLNLSVMPFSGLIDSVTYTALWMTKSFSYIPYSNFRIHDPPIIMIMLYYLSCMILVKSDSIRRFVPIAIVILFYLSIPLLSNDDLRVTFLDVGQGESSVIRLPDKKVMLIDGGARELHAGRSIVAPHLWSKGIKKIDYLVLSHPHPDHMGGLIYLLDNFEIKEVWTNGRMSDEAEEFFVNIEENQIRTRILDRGDFLDAQGYKIYVLHPFDEFHALSSRGEFSNENSSSLVIKIVSGSISMLFTGDIEAEAEWNLLSLGTWLKSDILKVPHHGGRTSSSVEFLRAVNPETVVISAGINNPFHHPHQESIQRYNNQDVRIFRTDMNGAVTITVKDKFYDIETDRDSRFIKAKNWADEIRNLKLLFK
jgi:competence protein ComEC